MSGEYDQMLLWDVINSDKKVDAPARFQFKDVTDPRLYPGRRRRYQPQDFIAVIGEERQPIITEEEAKKSLAFVLAMYESAENREGGSGEEVVKNKM